MAKTIKSGLDGLTEKLNSIKAKDIMTKKVITTTEATHLADVAGLMIRERISGLPVVGPKKKISGIVTANDLFIVMDMVKSGDVADNGNSEVFGPTVKFAMSADVIKIRKNTTLAEIIVIMKYKNAHTLPVFEGGRMVGVVGRRDVFKNFYAAVKSLYP